MGVRSFRHSAATRSTPTIHAASRQPLPEGKRSGTMRPNRNYIKRERSSLRPLRILCALCGKRFFTAKDAKEIRKGAKKTRIKKCGHPRVDLPLLSA
jgi:hypothetical protein